MFPVKAALAAAVLAGLAQWIGHLPALIVDSATFVGCAIYLCTKVLAPAGRLLKRVISTYEVIEDLQTSLDGINDRLHRLEGGQQEIKEPVTATARELGVISRDPHPELPPHRHTIPEA